MCNKYWKYDDLSDPSTRKMILIVAIKNYCVIQRKMRGWLVKWKHMNDKVLVVENKTIEGMS